MRFYCAAPASCRRHDILLTPHDRVWGLTQAATATCVLKARHLTWGCSVSTACSVEYIIQSAPHLSEPPNNNHPPTNQAEGWPKMMCKIP